MYNGFKTAKQGGETEEKEGPSRWLVPWGGKTGGHNLLEARTPLVPRVISPGGTERWSSGSVCSLTSRGSCWANKNKTRQSYPQEWGQKT